MQGKKDLKRGLNIELSNDRTVVALTVPMQIVHVQGGMHTFLIVRVDVT